MSRKIFTAGLSPQKPAVTSVNFNTFVDEAKKERKIVLFVANYVETIMKIIKATNEKKKETRRKKNKKQPRKRRSVRID